MDTLQPQAVAAIFGARTQPPRTRPEIVPRSALIERLLSNADRPVMLLSAPPGYGKTTVLAQWSARQPGGVAWLSIDKDDNDPALLLFDAACALHQADVIGSDVVESLRSPALSSSAALARLTPWVAAGGAVTMVLDHLEMIDNPDALDVVGGLIASLPDGSRVAVGSRSQPPLRAPLLRSRGELVEISVDELAMNRQEAELMFAALGARFTSDEIDLLVERTEGWPVGLYLAVLAAELGPSTVGGFAFRGDDRLMGDYMRTEIIAKLDPESAQFLTRTAVLDELSGDLCDHVLGQRGSQAMLESLEASNLLLVPLDRHREWFRYNRLFRDLLLAELRRNEPELVPTLHSRAAAWFDDDHRMRDTAIVHAQQAGDAAEVARLVTIALQPTYAAGRVATVRDWFEWFNTHGHIDHFPQIAVLGGMFEALRGQPASAERWEMVAERGSLDELLPDGSGIEAWRAYLRALSCRSGLAQMRADAQLAQALLAPGSQFRSGAILLEGISHLLEGDMDRADPILAHAAEVGAYLGANPSTSVAIAERALIAAARGDWDAARNLASSAMARAQEHRLDAYLEATIVYVVAARVALHDGDHAAARDLAGRAARLRPLLTYAVPASAQFLLELGKLYLALADPSGARTVLREVRDILHQRPDLGVVPEQAARLRQELEAASDESIAASSLTIAELRVLSYLPTHLSFREIGERLHISRNTVKTHAIAIYRKLAVTTRSEAIARAREVGLLGA